jgi:xanthine/uracil permease
MTENNENVQASGLDSKFMKVAMTIVSVLLMFGGAIYVPYLLSDIIHLDYGASNVIGIVLFIAGLGMLLFLIRKKVIE